MLGIKCIVNGKHKVVIDLVEHYGNYLKSKSKGATAKVDQVYDEIRNAGFEIDKQVVAYAYANSKLMGGKGVSTQKGLDKFSGEGIKSAVKIATKQTFSNNEIDHESTPIFIAKGIANIFARLQGKRQSNNSIAKQLQDTLNKIVKSKLDKQGVNTTQMTTDEILKKALSLEDLDHIAQQSVKGLKHSIGTLNDILQETKDAISQISSKIQSPTERAFYDQMVKEVSNGIFDLLLTDSEVEKILNNELKEVGLTKETTKNGVVSTSVDWNKAIREKDWRNQVEQNLLSKGFKQNEVDRVMTHMEKKFNEVKSNYIARRIDQITKDKNMKANPNKLAIDKIVEIGMLGMHSNQTKQILAKTLGIDNISDEVVNQINNISNEYTDMKDLFNGKLPLTFQETFNREVQILLGEYDLNKDPDKIKRVISHILRGTRDSVDTSLSLILSSTGNIVENTISGFPKTLLISLGRMLVTGGGKFKTDLFWNTFADVIKGGVSVKKALTKDVINFIETRENMQQRLNYERKGIDFSTPKSIAQTIIHSIVTTIGQINVAMDAANMAVQVYDRKVSGIKYNMLKTINPKTNKNYTNSEANQLINQAIYGEKAYNEAYKIVQKAVDNSTLIKDWKSKKGRAVYEQVVNNFLKQHIINEDVMEVIEDAAINNSNKELGRVSDLIVSAASILQAGQQWVSKQNTFAGELYRRLNFAVAGNENWFFQKIQRKLGIGAIFGLGNIGYDLFKSNTTHPSIYSRHYIIDTSTPQALAKYKKDFESRQANIARIRRGTVDAIVFYTLAYLLKTLSMSMLSGDDDDDDEKKRKYNEYMESLMRQPVLRRLFTKFIFNEIIDEVIYAYDRKKKELDPKKMKENNLSEFIIGEYTRNLQSFYMQNIQNRGVLAGIDDNFKLIDQIYGRKETVEQINNRKIAEVLSQATSLIQVPGTSLYEITKGEIEVYRNFYNVIQDPTILDSYTDKQKKDYKKLSNYFRDHKEEALKIGFLNKSLYISINGLPKESETLTDISGIAKVTLEKLNGINITTTSQLKDKSINQLNSLKDIEGKNIFDYVTSISIYNQLNGETEGSKNINSLNFSEDDINTLKKLGYEGIDINNKNLVIKDIKMLRKKLQITETGNLKDFSAGKNKYELEKIIEYNKLIEQLGKIE